MISSLASLPLVSRPLQPSRSAPGSGRSAPPCDPEPPSAGPPGSPAPPAVFPATLPNPRSAPSSPGWSDAATLSEGAHANEHECKVDPSPTPQRTSTLTLQVSVLLDEDVHLMQGFLQHTGGPGRMGHLAVHHGASRCHSAERTHQSGSITGQRETSDVVQMASRRLCRRPQRCSVLLTQPGSRPQTLL